MTTLRAIADDGVQSLATRPDPLTEPTLKVRRVAAILGIGERAVYEAVARHELPARRLGARLIIIPTSAFLAWLDGVDQEAP